MATRRLAAVLALALATAARAQTPTVPGLYFPDWYDAHAREAEPVPREFRLINYFFTRVTVSNAIGDPSGLKGVALGPYGVLAGSQVYAGATGPGFFVEQRWIPVFEYQPRFLDGRAAFRAQVEIDYMWGRSANTVQPNEGGGFNADQVNLQTKNVNIAIYPTKDPDDLTVLVGTQSVYDTPLDPTRTPLGDIIRTGYKLAFLGSDATGLSLFSSRFGRARLAWFPLGSAQPDKATGGDPRLKYVWLAMADAAREVAPGTWLGASAWLLKDDTKGDAYAYEGLVRSGPASGGLAAYTGFAPMSIERPSGQVVYLGVNGHHNIDYRTGPVSLSGFFMATLGRYTSNNPSTLLNRAVDVRGYAANLEAGWNYGAKAADVATLEGVWASGDSDLTDGTATSPQTLNVYGLPGAVWFNHRMLLLFPFTSTVGNYTGAVTDLSNQGAGLLALVATGTRELLPGLSLKLGVGHGRAAATPPAYAGSVTARGRTIGTEIDAELKWSPKYLFTLGLHAGYLIRGDWFDGETSRVTADPWAAFTTLTWYAF